MVALMGTLHSGQTRRARPASQAAQMHRCAHGSSSTRTCALQHTQHCVGGASTSSGRHSAELAVAAASAAAAHSVSGGTDDAGGGDGGGATASPLAPNTTKRKPCGAAQLSASASGCSVGN